MEEEFAKLFKSVLAMFGISALAAASRTILSEDRRTFGGFIRGLVLAGFVGIMAGLIIQDYAFSPATQGAIVGVAAFIADDILILVLGVAEKLRDNPGLIIDFIIRRRK
ncbi:MAG: hypothetical protein KDA17_07540 [Candidatus Saccharibacteria bacterium]|nr:hypothetical protein [Candidatus Saccharibacteria bacterium]